MAFFPASVEIMNSLADYVEMVSPVGSVSARAASPVQLVRFVEGRPDLCESTFDNVAPVPFDSFYIQTIPEKNDVSN